MKFITVEQFYKADKKVKDSIMEWWEPNEYDLISYYDIILLTKQLKRGYESIKAELIPLLTVGQLIEFIEWKTKYKIENTIRDNTGFYEFMLYDYINGEYMMDYLSWDEYGWRCVTEETDLLQALWIMTQEIVSK